MEYYAETIGADCAFFIKNKPALATGKGNVLKELNVDFSNYKIVLIKPEINLNTAHVYSLIKPKEDAPNLEKSLLFQITEWKNYFFNDFESVIFYRHPELQQIKNEMYTKGAYYAAMSGSGSSIYGVFDKNANFEKLNFSAKYHIVSVLNDKNV